MLIFEHLVQISGLLDPLSDSLTREQLWRGLVLRAEQPKLFIDGLDAYRILSCTRYVFKRELRYGKTLMCDWVTLMPEQAVRYEIAATSVHVGGVLTMSIEQPDELQLFLRFKYESTLPDIGDDELHHLLEIVKAAYRQEDINTAYLIRKYARRAR